MSHRKDLRLALELADAADATSLPSFRSHDLRVDIKPDTTPVSEADRAAEERIREILERERPGDGVFGEEFGVTGGGPRRWILDPIDGTVNYLRGVPVWATLIALEDDGEITVGVVSAPALRMRWWAARGEGSWGDAMRMRVSTISELARAHLSFNSIRDHTVQGIGEQAAALSERCERTRGFGDFWSFMLLAAGAVDVVVEPVAAAWDLAPLLVIVEEAGGTFTDLTGARRIDGGNAVATNGPLHHEVLEILRA